MATQRLKVSELRILDYNPRKIDKDDFLELKKSIINDPNFLEVRPILVNFTEGTYYIYAGTQRYLACLELGHKEVTCIVDTDLTEEQQKERMAKDNSHYGHWDIPKLQALDLTPFKGMHIDPIIESSPKDKAKSTTGVKQEKYTYKVPMDSKEEKDILVGAVFTAKQQTGYQSTEELFLNREN